MKTDSKYKLIKQMERNGVLSSELCPEPDYWHWAVLKPDELPLPLQEEYKTYGEVRW